MSFERIGSEEVWGGRIASVRVERFRHEDGREVEREIVGHPGAVAVLAHDGERFWVVVQPREAVGEPALVELPAGKLDEEGEGPLETARRELAEEIGKGARTWRHLTSFFSSAGFSDEEIHVYEATDLYDEHADSGEEERIVVETVPLADLDRAIAESRDAKSLVAMLWLRAYGPAAR